MTSEPQSLYLQLGQLVADTPSDLVGPGSLSTETHRWLGRAGALIEAQAKAAGMLDTVVMYDNIHFSTATNGLSGVLREHKAHEIVTILHRALARAELNAPAAARGAFIGVGAEFDALQAMGKVLREATKNLLFIDAYMDEKVLTDFAPLAPEGVVIWVFGDSSSSKVASLRPAAERWVKQYGATRPLEVRLSAPRALHDRLVVVDAGTRVWNLSQSLNHFVARSPASIVRFDADVAAMKRDHYLSLWGGATLL